MTGLRKMMATTVAGALLATSATPALARPGGWGNPGWGGGWGGHRRWRHRDGIDVGDVILGAIIIGGIAAVASAASNSGRDRTRNRDGNWGGGWSRDEGTEDEAVDACARAAEREGSRYGNGAKVEDITSVARQDGGYRIHGVVSADRSYGNGRYNDNSRFSCSVRYGQVEDIHFDDDRSAFGY